MPDPEHAMLAYAQLADLSRRKQQQPGQEKFLILTAIAALRAGWPEVADRSREAVLHHNPQHILGQYESMAGALRDPDFTPFLRRMERFCPYEKAETLLEGLGLSATPVLEEEDSPGTFALRLVTVGLEEGNPEDAS